MESDRPLRAAVVTVSTSRAAGGEAADESGDALAELVSSLGGDVVARELIADDRERIERTLRHLCDEIRCELVLTTGGTGFAVTDLTPEATEAVIDRRAPGIAEAIRGASAAHTAHWMLSRGVAGIRGRALIVNFPGSPKAIAQSGAAIAPALPHALSLLRGRAGGHGAP